MSNPTELPDLDKLEEQVRRAYMADARFVAFLQPGTILDIIQMARRAQPEGEAPQAERECAKCHGEGGKQVGHGLLGPEWDECSACNGTGILANPAATLSPLCGAQHTESGKEVAAKPPFPISDDEMAALRRFWECATDGEGYDVEKAMMQRLAEMGLVQRKSGAYYMATDFGLYVLDEYTIQRAAQLDGGQEGSESNG